LPTLDAALDVWDGVDLADLRRASIALPGTTLPNAASCGSADFGKGGVQTRMAAV
jgi:kynureninase